MRQPLIKNYDELPLFINATLLAQLFGVSRMSAYELMSEKDFPSFRIGKRILVSKKESRVAQRNEVLDDEKCFDTNDRSDERFKHELNDCYFHPSRKYANNEVEFIAKEAMKLLWNMEDSRQRNSFFQSGNQRTNHPRDDL